jgi:hypothetical protein
VLYLIEGYDKSGQQFDNGAVKPNLGLCYKLVYVLGHVTVGVGSDLLHLTLVNTLLTTV